MKNLIIAVSVLMASCASYDAYYHDAEGKEQMCRWHSLSPLPSVTEGSARRACASLAAKKGWIKDHETTGNVANMKGL